jgi:hypothetical protein
MIGGKPRGFKFTERFAVTNVIFRFIEYLSQGDANDAVKALNGRELCGNTVEVMPYV